MRIRVQRAGVGLTTVMWLTLCCALWGSWSEVKAQSIRTQDTEILIGVLAFRGGAHALRKWQRTADYLTSAVGDYEFQIVPLGLDQMASAIQSQAIDFALTNPGHYVNLESRLGATRIATLKNYLRGQSYTRYGAAIISRQSDQTIHDLADLKGKSFMAISANAFGGYQMAWRELHRLGLGPDDFSELRFSGFPQDEVVYAVLRGDIDAGTVRAETLSRMGQEGKVDLSKIRILNQQQAERYPFPHSTPLYPEWAFAKLRHTSDAISQQVAIALLEYKAEVGGSHYGWTIPLDYSPVHEVFQTLKIGPYQSLGEIRLRDVLYEYAVWIVLIAIIILSLLGLNCYVARINQRLAVSERKLRDEVQERTLAQQELAEHKRQLEERVDERTQELQQDIEIREQVEKMLRKSEGILRSLYEITHDDQLSFSGKVEQLLAAACAYFELNQARITQFNGERGHLYISYDVTSNRYQHDMDLGRQQSMCEMTARQESTIIMNSPAELPKEERAIYLDNQTECYIGTPIYIGREIYGTLCFYSDHFRSSDFNQVDQDIVHLMAQWIGNEMYRLQTESQASQHKTELEHATRIGTLGEMATGLAHEVNQPLTAISNYLQGYLRRHSATKSDDLTAIEHAIDEARRAAAIIKQMREFVSGREQDREQVQINDCIDYAVDMVGHAFPEDGVAYELSLDKQLPIIEADRIQLEQVVINILMNSHDAVRSAKNKGEIHITTQYTDGNVRLTVCDNGIGVPEDQLDEIFHPFETNKQAGLGLGLSISRSIIESHQGKMTASLNDMRGICIEITVPVSREDDE